MRQIERLLREARRLHSVNGKNMFATVFFDEGKGKFIVDGKACRNGNEDAPFAAQFDTLEAAFAFIDEMENKYQPSEKLTFMIDYGNMPEGVSFKHED